VFGAKLVQLLPPQVARRTIYAGEALDVHDVTVEINGLPATSMPIRIEQTSKN
jgi:hypothetical protein